LEFLVRLPESDLKVVEDWFATTKRFTSLEWSDYADAVSKTELDVDQFEQCVSILVYILSRSVAEGLKLEDIIHDFEELGFDPDLRPTLQRILEGLLPIGPKVHADRLQRFYEQAGLPTVDDVNIVCDLRPVFADLAYQAPPLGARYSEVVGFTHVVIMEITTSGAESYDPVQKISFQLSEREFERLSEGFDRAKKQLSVLKELTARLR
jgi:hypothetical protein